MFRPVDYKNKYVIIYNYLGINLGAFNFIFLPHGKNTICLWTRVLHRKIDGTTMNRNTNPKIPVIIMDLRLLKGKKKVIASFSGLLVVNLLGTCISDYNRIWLYHFRLWPEGVTLSTLTCHSTSLIGLYILQAIVGQRPWCWSFTYASPNQLTTFQTKNNNHERNSNFYTRGKINLEA